MVLSVVANGAAVPSDGVLIPQSDLSAQGLTSGELTNNISGIQRAIRAVLKKYSDVSLTGVIGITKPANPAQTIPTFDLVNTTYSTTFTLVGNLIGDTLSELPLPSTGISNGVGGVDVTDIFPNAAKVANGANSPALGLFIPTGDLANYGSPIHADLDLTSGSDNRDWLFAFFNYLTLDADPSLALRTTSVASAIIAKTSGTPTVGTFPANSFDATNPITGLTPSDNTKGYLIPVAKTFSMTIQTATTDTDTLDINFVAA